MSRADVTMSSVAELEPGQNIAWVYANKDSLAGQSVSLRGKVVKYNSNILGWNFLHIQDGSGDAAERQPRSDGDQQGHDGRRRHSGLSRARSSWTRISAPATSSRYCWKTRVSRPSSSAATILRLVGAHLVALGQDRVDQPVFDGGLRHS